MNALVSSTRAELLRLGRWPAMWVMLGVGMALNILFGYVFKYLSYRTRATSRLSEDTPAAELVKGLLPAAVPEATVQGMPMFGGAILLILGALAIGSGYGWGTWKTVFTRGPSRAAAYGGTLTALAVIAGGLVVAAFMANFGMAALIAGIESQPLVWPPASEVGQVFGAALLIYAMWAACGVLLGTLARSPALAVGLGLVWSLAVENLLRGLGNVLGPVQTMADLLPGTAAGSLAGALGATAFSTRGGTPGVLTTLGGAPAGWLLVGYTVAFAAAAGLLITRRDI